MGDTASIRSFLSEARKYRVPLVVATQFLSQLDRDVATAIFGNVGTLICLRCNVVDAPLLQRELGEFTTEDLLDLEIGQAIVRMGPAKDAFNLVIPEQVPPEKDCRKEIISLSRERYCRARAEVEALLNRKLEVETTKEPTNQKHNRNRQDSKNAVQGGLSSDQWRMLEYLADHPDKAVKAVYLALGFSVWRGSNVRQQLKNQGLVVEVETRLGQGNRPALFLVPTIAGLQAVNKPNSNGRGGAVHRHFQDMVASHAWTLGYQVDKEHRLESGGSVDVHLSRGEDCIAVEIGVHSRPQRECHNIRKCLEAGYRRVLALFLDPELLQRTRSLFARDATAEERQKVVFLEVGKIGEGLRQ